MSIRGPGRRVKGDNQTHTARVPFACITSPQERGVMAHDNEERQEGRHRGRVERQLWGEDCTPLWTPWSSVRVPRLCTYSCPFCARKSRFSSIALQQNRDAVRMSLSQDGRHLQFALPPFQSSSPFVLVVHVAPRVLASQGIQ